MFNAGFTSLTYKELLESMTEFEILSYYFDINKIPTLINSPLRKDKNPSFCFYSPDGKSINYIDFASKERGSLLTFLTKYWNCSYSDVITKIANSSIRKISLSSSKKSIFQRSNSELKCIRRNWKQYDIDYWESYGITREWLDYCEVYPVDTIIIEGANRFAFKADKYAYAYVEHKEGRTTLKIYQPFNKSGHKWYSKHDKSVISLWTKVPKKGPVLCICSSVKDALCLWINTGIPSVAPQGEGYILSDTAINVLKQRFEHIFILFDNDDAGRRDSILLSKNTGFTNIVLPVFDGGKDVSDLYKAVGKEKFKQIITPLFKEKL